MKFKKKVLIIVILVIALIISIVVIHKLINKKKVKSDAQIDYEIRQKTVKEYTEDKVIPIGVSELYGQYEGTNDKDELYKSLNSLANTYLPELFKNLKGLNDQQLSNYYNQNSSAIEEKLGLQKEENFINLAKYLQSFDYNNNKFENAEIDSDSYDTAGDNSYLTFIIKLRYTDLSEVNLRVYFANMTSTTPRIIYAYADE